MKITKRQLQRIIKEELEKVLKELGEDLPTPLQILDIIKAVCSSKIGTDEAKSMILDGIVEVLDSGEPLQVLTDELKNIPGLPGDIESVMNTVMTTPVPDRLRHMACIALSAVQIKCPVKITINWFYFLFTHCKYKWATFISNI